MKVTLQDTHHRRKQVEYNKPNIAMTELFRLFGVYANVKDLPADTPERVASAWEYWLSGYKIDTRQLLQTQFCIKELKDKNENTEILIKKIPFYSHCSHHLTPFFGTVDIHCNIRGHTVVGLSKFHRLVEAHALRLQTQEGMTSAILHDIINFLPTATSVEISSTARHLCIESRGIKQPSKITVIKYASGIKSV